jgi:hypothetical protein
MIVGALVQLDCHERATFAVIVRRRSILPYPERKLSPVRFALMAVSELNSASP